MSGRPDLNRGPPLPQSGALTGLRHVPLKEKLYSCKLQLMQEILQKGP